MENKRNYSVVRMCKVFKINARAYYSWQANPIGKRAKRREMLKIEITKVYYHYKGRYGSPRITKELNMQGIIVSQRLVAKLMQQLHLKSIIRKRYKVTTDSSHSYSLSTNVLNRNFTVLQENSAWVSDITYIPTAEGWLYLTAVIDLFDRKTIGWSLSDTLKTNETTLPAFNMAKRNRQIQANQTLIFHSDRGVQYACDEFKTILKQNTAIIQSMSRKGNCWDNAVAESFFKSLKSELTNHCSYTTRKQAELAIFEYIETFYNKTRRHKHLNNLTINEFYQLNNNLKNAA